MILLDIIFNWAPVIKPQIQPLRLSQLPTQHSMIILVLRVFSTCFCVFYVSTCFLCSILLLMFMFALCFKLIFLVFSSIFPCLCLCLFFFWGGLFMFMCLSFYVFFLLVYLMFICF